MICCWHVEILSLVVRDAEEELTSIRVLARSLGPVV